MQRIFTYLKIYRRVRNFILYLIGGLILLIVLLFLLIKIPAVQNWATQKTTNWLSEKLNTTVAIDAVDISILSHLILEGLYIEDQQQDTLLYAGHFEVRIGNFNIFRKSVKLKNISLDNAYVNIYRTWPDSTYNYEFIADAFRVGKIPVDTLETKKTTDASLDLSLNKLTIENSRLRMYDGVSFQHFDVQITNAEFLINKLDLKNQLLALEKIEFEKVSFGYTSLFDTIPEIDEESYDTIHIALGEWQIETTQLFLKSCAFNYKNENAETQPAGINFNDLGLSDINIKMYDIFYLGDTITARINQIALKDKSGFEIDTFKTSLLFSPYEVTLNNLKITTPHSRIQDQFAMTFTTLNDFDRIETDVRFRANLVNTKISAKDIAYFTSGLEGYDEVLEIATTVSGPMSSLKLRDFNASVEGLAGLKGNITVRGLPILDETFVDVEMEPLFVDFAQVEKLIGAGKLPAELINLGKVNYNGRITGFVYNLVAYGNFVTSQGLVKTDMNFIYEKGSGNSQFEGKFNTTQLNLGAIIGQPELVGSVSMTATIDGGITNKKPDFIIASTIQSVGFNDYTYSNIVVNGALNDNAFEGDFTVDDPNLVMTFNGLVDFSDTIPAYDFSTNIRANLQPLNFYKDSLSVIGTATLKANGKNIDDLTGVANFSNLIFLKGRNIYKLDTLLITSTSAGNIKTITAASDLIDFKIEGQFLMSKLPATVKRLVTYYTTGNDSVSVNNQQAVFTINIKNADRLAAIFYPDIQVIRNVAISGDLNSRTNEFNTRVRIDKLSYLQFKFDTILFETKTVSNTLAFFAKINATTVAGETKLPPVAIDGTFSQNNLAYVFKLGRDTDSNRLDLHGEIYFDEDFIALKILPSEILYNSERWEILANNSLKITDNNLLAENFMLTSGDQLISLSSVADETYQTVLKLSVKNIPVGELFETFILPGEDVSGVLNGDVTIGNIFDHPSFIGKIEINEFTLNGKNYGQFKAETARIQPSNKIKITAGLSGNYGFKADGFYTPASGGGKDDLTMELLFTKTPISLAEPFMKGILSELKGDAYGAIKISGNTNELGMAGSVKIQKGGMRIDYIGAVYKFDTLRVNIDKNRITIPPQTIKDLYNNKGILEGAIGYNNFSNWDFKKLSLVSDKIEMMNVTKKENPDFWGYAIGKVSANITGGLDNLLITVVATPTDSVFILPAYGSGNVTKHDFIRFIDRSEIGLPDKNEMNLSIVNVDLIVNITPAIDAKILINSEETEFLIGRGFGTLHIEANTLGTVKIDGKLSVSEGFYDFSFQNLFPRRFVLRKGGSIKFDGDPYKAEFDLVASSRIDDVAVKTLTGTTSTEKVDVDVLVMITGTLGAPVIDFDIITAGNSSVSSDFERSLAQVKSDKNELNKQVFGLLITKSFLPPNLTTYNPVSSTVNNTMNDFISSQLSVYFENVLREFLKDAEVDVGIKSMEDGDYNFTNTQGQQFVFSLKQEIAKNLTVKVGTTYSDLSGSTAAVAGTSALAGDFEVEYLLTEDGRIRLKAFNITEYDAIVAKNLNRTGVGIYYTKDFDKLKELWTRDPEKKKRRAEKKGS